MVTKKSFCKIESSKICHELRLRIKSANSIGAERCALLSKVIMNSIFFFKMTMKNSLSTTHEAFFFSAKAQECFRFHDMLRLLKVFDGATQILVLKHNTFIVCI